MTPPGYRLVNFHGLAIDVPVNWQLNATKCGQPIRDTVILPGPVPLCAAARLASVTSVEFVEAQLPGLDGTLAQAASRSFSLAGERATRLTGRRDSTFVIAVTVPALSAQVVIASPSSALADSLAATLTIADVDSHGCPTHADDVTVLPRGDRPSRAGAADALDSRTAPPDHGLPVCRNAGRAVDDPGCSSARVVRIQRHPHGPTQR